MLRVLACMTERHDPELVLLATLICALASGTVVLMLARGLASVGRSRAAWTVGAAIAFGSGVWAVHFVAMLGYQPGIATAYDVSWTTLSLLIATLGALPGIALFLFRPRNPIIAALSGAMLGLAITGMHFTGMMAMRLGAIVMFDRRYVAAALVLAVGFSALALVVAGRWQTALGRLLAGVLLVLAIIGLHFTGMTAVALVPVLGNGIAPPDAVLTPDLLAIAVSAVSALVLLAGFTLALWDARLARRDAAEVLRIRQLADAAFEGLVIHRDGVIRDVNIAFAELIGAPASAIIGRSILDFVDESEVQHAMERLAAGRTELEECVLRREDGTRREVEVLARGIGQGKDAAMVVAVRDISERKEAAQHIHYLAHHDPLTGLANRVLLRERIEIAINRAASRGEMVALLSLDLDRFKVVNDLYGHQAGDEVLIRVGARLRQVVRNADVVGRLGGDEFIVILPIGKQAGPALEAAQRLIAALAEPLEIGGQFAQIGGSVGIALAPQHGGTPDDLLRNADTALYAAKRAGRGTARLFDPAMDAELQNRRRLERDLRRAVRERTLDVHYQPLFARDGTTITGFEALARWIHAERGPIAPGEFIPLAEESGLIVPLGGLVLDIACAEAASWPLPHLVAVNVSPEQLRAGDLVATVADCLARTGLAPERLELEVTESILIEDAKGALATLNALKGLGLRIVLDDFGTGYSSLSYLRRFPFDKLKIDHSFVQSLGQDQEATAIVRAILALAQSLGLDVTAEGVETGEQLRLLQALSCTQIQGYLLGRPQSAAALSTLLASGTRAPANDPIGGGPRGFAAVAQQS
uniref:EAL domain-containing protein n=1 Tax=Acidicaldus sp. TaxID=1872105 RepID=A0A8J4M5M7_9PROT